MTFTQQFLLVSLLSISFLLLAVVHLWAGKGQRQLFLPWLLLLLTGAVWASGSLAYYSATGIGVEIRIAWRLVSNYALTLLPICLLWTTVRLIEPGSKRRQRWLGLALLLWLLALGLDPAVWPYRLPTLSAGSLIVRHLDIWGAFWLASWLLPGFLTWRATQEPMGQLPGSVYRNRLYFWLTAVLLILGGSAIALPRELGWRELGELIAVSGSVVGSRVVWRRQLPDYFLTLRQLWNRLLVVLLLFGLTWLLLWLIIPLAVPSPAGIQELEIVFVAGLLALLYLLVNHLVQRLASRIFLPPTVKRNQKLSQIAQQLQNEYAPTAVTQQALTLIQEQLQVDHSWFLTAHEGGWGRLLLQPLVCSGPQPKAVVLEANSPLAAHFLNHSEPVLLFDLMRLPSMPAAEQAENGILEDLAAVVYVPWHSSGRLLGLLALGARTEAKAYTNLDLAFLQEMAMLLASLLAQAQLVTSLHEVAGQAASQYRAVQHANLQLQQANDLFHDFLHLFGPDLRRPFEHLSQQFDTLQSHLTESIPPAAATEIRAIWQQTEESIGQTRHLVHSFIGLADRLQKQIVINCQPVVLDDLVREVWRGLTPMAQARRVEVTFSQHGAPLMVWGDPQRLREAIHHLLHNAIKFNKIGGTVQLECGHENQAAYLRLMDSGVGIPEDRLANIWTAFPDLNKLQEQITTGTRLGLRLTHFIIQVHGGRVAASSTYGRGSCFAFYLPLRPDLKPPENSDQ
jgi:two-component system, OmpR family, phosphate regulon sensor histidine kinase PhoR